MDYPRILRQIYQEPWGVLPSTHEIIRTVVDNHVRGQSAPVSILPERRNHFNARALEFEVPRSRGSRVYRRGVMAYVPVEGIIGKNLSLIESLCGGYDINQLALDVDEVASDPTVQNVLFDYNSPGGQVVGLLEAAEMLRELSGTKTTYSVTTTQSCSAAYWLMSQSTNVYATQTAILGSIGIFTYLLDCTEKLKSEGIKPILVKAGKHKGAGLPGNPLTDEDLKMLQDQVDMIYGMMTHDINTTRPQVTEAAMQGQVFIGKQALEAKLIDATIKSLGSLVQRIS